MTISRRSFVVVLAVTFASLPSLAQDKSSQSDIPAEFNAPKSDYDYTKRVEMIPMRDGVKLYTVIVIPKGATHAPILLTRTPYDAAARTMQTESPHMLDELPPGDDVFVRVTSAFFKTSAASMGQRAPIS
jgi:hypothetical protein